MPGRQSHNSSSHSLSKWQLLKTSYVYQCKEFFNNSNLHGVRFIVEKNRPFYEQFIWICCVLVCVVVNLVMMFSLWEKFQTEPTITVLDTDSDEWNIPFPDITVCPQDPVDPQSVKKFIEKRWGKNITENNDAVDFGYYEEFVTKIATLTYENIQTLAVYEGDPELADLNLKDVAASAVITCNNLLYDCSWSECCEIFRPIFNEIGFCFTFKVENSKRDNTTIRFGDEKSDSAGYTFENDAHIPFKFNVKGVDSNPLSIFLHSSVEKIGSDVRPQHAWTGRVGRILFSSEETYTTENAKQLSVKQRRCVFPNEIPLLNSDVYTYESCMTQCRMNMARRRCGCVPYFYLDEEIDGYESCNIGELACIAYNRDEIEKNLDCDCELSCMNTVYKVEKLEGYRKVTSAGDSLTIAFISTPLMRYKRDVLFGWVDLFVAFGGIAGLFLGFSLLTAVETLYFFTLRACCMSYREQDKLRELRRQYEDATEERETSLDSKSCHDGYKGGFLVYQFYLP